VQTLHATESQTIGSSTASACEVTIVAHHIGPVGGMERILSELVLGLRRRGHPVTVIAYGCYPWFMLAGTLAVRRRRRGLVLAMGAIVLNDVDIVAIQYCQHVGPTAPSRPSWPFRLNAAAAKVVGRLGERVCFPRNDPARFVCASEGVAEEIREHFPEQADRAITIPNGVDVDAFAPGSRGEEAAALRERLRLAPDRLVAIFVGSEWGRKGLEPAIRALAQAPGWDLLVVGNGDRERYERLADELGVATAVHWLGVSSDVAPIYQVADAFVFPTSYEAFPLVALEAAASGLPILATPVNGIRELVTDGANGFLISRDPTDIATRLRELGDDPGLRRRLGSAARASAMDYSWAKMVDRHHELYADLVGPPSG
jgi:glycosyltransferase involved in cell wall biosynthesis